MGMFKSAASAVRKQEETPKPINKIEVADEILMMPWQIIHPDPDQPRTQRDQEEFQKVRMTIKATGGNTQAICVKPHPTIKGEYMIVYGEGRWLCCKEFDFKVKVTLLKEDSTKSAEAIKFDTFFLQIAENVGRNDLSSIDEARSLQKLIDLSAEIARDNPSKKKLSQKDIVEQFGYSKTKVSRLLSLLQAPKSVVDLSQQNVTQNLNVLNVLTQLSERVPVDELSETIEQIKAGTVNEKQLQAKLKESKASQENQKQVVVSKSGTGKLLKADNTDDKSNGGAALNQSSNPRSDVKDEERESVTRKLIACETFEIIDSQLLVYGENLVEPIVLSKVQMTALKKLLSKK
ncbi:ParB/RepB/Spo0J family partition protein [Vibrio furnissii]|uniref:ParB/RepB/Spo0J family partition protein n=1 Tax=Vibrio furnissii TaxID=29494 RepID=UPI001C9C1A00|nr:ParB/RepB/Spo0J family partition protein [Vibrio furnissii]MBY7933091.1 ParB/RepB/Spo0J family partition protein [Vibrio fluvialis]MCG6268450.1 ParB/RepB/Spo0J family partition protein [Vibrio furnissii]